jgi:hypothetical protein
VPGAVDPSWNPANWNATAWALLSPYVLAVLTVAAAWIRRKRRRPALSLAYGDIQECATAIPFNNAWAQGPPAAYGRLLVSNALRRDAAQGVHVVVTSYRRLAPSEDRVDLRMALAWTHSAPTETIATIHGGSPRLIDLVSVTRGITWGELRTHPRTPAPPIAWLVPDLGGATVSSIWEVRLDLVADGVAPLHFKLQIHWDGAWVGGPSAPHLSVRSLERDDGPATETATRKRKYCSERDCSLSSTP